jgi:hypothetical protein
MARNTTSEKELRRLVGEGLNFRQISDKLGISADMIRQCASVLGIRSQVRSRRASIDVDAALARIAQGMGLTGIAAETGVTRRGLHAALKRANYPTTPAEYLKHLAASQEKKAA